MSIRIHGVPPSPFVRKVRVFCAEKDIPYELIPQQPVGQSPEYLAKSPLGKIPCLEEDDGFTLPDSSVICAYLERTHPEPALYPANPRALGRALWLEEYADTKLAEVCGLPFFERVVKGIFFQQAPDDARVAKIVEQDQPPAFDYLERQLAEGDGAFLVDGRLSIADVSVASLMAQLGHADLSLDADRWPRLAAWTESLHGRPSFKSCLEEEKAILASVRR